MEYDSARLADYIVTLSDMKTLSDMETPIVVSAMKHCGQVALLLERALETTGETSERAAVELGEFMRTAYDDEMILNGGFYRDINPFSYMRDWLMSAGFGTQYLKLHGAPMPYTIFARYLPENITSSSDVGLMMSCPIVGIIQTCLYKKRFDIIGIVVSHHIAMFTHIKEIMKIDQSLWNEDLDFKAATKRDVVAEIINEAALRGGEELILDAFREDFPLLSSSVSTVTDRLRNINRLLSEIYDTRMATPEFLSRIVDTVVDQIPDTDTIRDSPLGVDATVMKNLTGLLQYLEILDIPCNSPDYAFDRRGRGLIGLNIVRFLNDFMHYRMRTADYPKVTGSLLESFEKLCQTSTGWIPDEMYIHTWLRDSERYEFYFEYGTFIGNLIGLYDSALYNRLDDMGRVKAVPIPLTTVMSYANFITHTKDPLVGEVLSNIPNIKRSSNVLDALYGVALEITLGYTNPGTYMNAIEELIPSFGIDSKTGMLEPISVDLLKIHPSPDIGNYYNGNWPEGLNALDNIVALVCENLADFLQGKQETDWDVIKYTRIVRYLTDPNRGYWNLPTRIYVYNYQGDEALSYQIAAEDSGFTVPVWLALWSAITCYNHYNREGDWPEAVGDECFGYPYSGRNDLNQMLGENIDYMVEVASCIYSIATYARAENVFDSGIFAFENYLQDWENYEASDIEFVQPETLISWLSTDPWYFYYGSNYDVNVFPATGANEPEYMPFNRVMVKYLQTDAHAANGLKEKLTIRHLVANFDSWGDDEEYPAVPFEIFSNEGGVDDMRDLVEVMAGYCGFPADVVSNLNADAQGILDEIYQDLIDNGHVENPYEDEDGNYDGELDGDGGTYGGVTAANANKTYREIRDSECSDFAPGTMGYKKCTDAVCLNDIYGVERLHNLESQFEDPYSQPSDEFSISGVYEILYVPNETTPVIMSEKNASRVDSGLKMFVNELMEIVSTGRTEYTSIRMLDVASGSNSDHVIEIKTPIADETSFVKFSTEATSLAQSPNVRLYEVDIMKLKFVMERLNGKSKSMETVSLGLRDFVKQKSLLKSLSPGIRNWYNMLLTTLPKESAAERYEFVVSARPVDFLRASACQPWMSCHNPHGVNQRCPEEYAEYAGNNYISYLTRHELDPEWLGRVYLLKASARGEDTLSIQRIYTSGGSSKYHNIISDAIFWILNSIGGIPELPDTDKGRFATFLTPCDLQRNEVMWHNSNPKKMESIIAVRGEGFLKYIRPLTPSE